LHSIRKAKAEASAGNIDEASYLRLGIIEDFDSDIIPELAIYLTNNMRQCEFMYHTDSSNKIIEMLRNRQLDIGIISNSTERLAELQDRPLLKDPFVIASPLNHEKTPLEIIHNKTNLPFLRFPKNMIIGRQIDSHLRRIGINLPSKFECGNSQTLLAMVADGAGWTITTPLIISRAKRFQPKLKIHPFPIKAFSRDLAVVATPDCSRLILDLVDKKMRKLIEKHVIKQTHKNAPWIANSFNLIE
jgi:DNA-binding transcriptional LysR family regulator